MAEQRLTPEVQIEILIRRVEALIGELQASEEQNSQLQFHIKKIEDENAYLRSIVGVGEQE